MSDKKLKFDPETLQYVEIKKSTFFSILKYILGLLTIASCIAIVIFFTWNSIFDSPIEKQLRHENKILNKEYAKQLEKYKKAQLVVEELEEKDKNIYRAIFEAEPPENKDNIKNLVDYNNFSENKLLEKNNIFIDSLKNYLSAIKNNINAIRTLIENNKGMMRYIPAIQPISNKDLSVLIYGFGNKLDPFYRTPTFHNGIDYVLEEGSEVIATADGEIIKTVFSDRINGMYIIIDHGNGIKTKYSHLSKIIVNNRKSVKRGQKIAHVGNSGKSFMPHLHYEVIINKESINPINFFFLELSPNQYRKIIEQTSQAALSLD